MDQINFTLSLDKVTEDALSALAPHKSVFDFDKPRKVSGNLAMPKQVVSTISSWLSNSHGENVDPEKLQRMAMVLDA